MHDLIIVIKNIFLLKLFIITLVGEVELENLPLRKDALKGLELPVEVHSGKIPYLLFSLNCLFTMKSFPTYFKFYINNLFFINSYICILDVYFIFK